MKIGKQVGKSIENTLSRGKKYVWRTIIAAVVLLGIILISRPLYLIVTTSMEIRELSREKALYKSAIRRDSILLENLKNDDFLERYAREKYLMKGKNEEVFIIE